jgi:hypothetical protein
VTEYLLAILSLALVLCLISWFDLVLHCKTAINLARQSNATLFDRALSDLQKEQRAQHMAKQMLRQLGLIILAGCGAFMLPLLPLYLLSWLHVINIEKIFDALMSFELLLGFSVISLLFFLKFNRG